jgi:hypothetical protein
MCVYSISRKKKEEEKTEQDIQICMSKRERSG